MPDKDLEKKPEKDKPSARFSFQQLKDMAANVDISKAKGLVDAAKDKVTRAPAQAPEDTTETDEETQKSQGFGLGTLKDMAANVDISKAKGLVDAAKEKKADISKHIKRARKKTKGQDDA